MRKTIKLTCSECGKEFEKLLYQYRVARNRLQTKFYCNQECITIYQKKTYNPGRSI